MEDRRQRVLRASKAVEQARDAVESEAVAARGKLRQPVELCLDGRIVRPREVRHQAAFFFSGER